MKTQICNSNTVELYSEHSSVLSLHLAGAPVSQQRIRDRKSGGHQSPDGG
jgi:hypothetical protein